MFFFDNASETINELALSRNELVGFLNSNLTFRPSILEIFLIWTIGLFPSINEAIFGKLGRNKFKDHIDFKFISDFCGPFMGWIEIKLLHCGHHK
ncbi:hypothetical protein ES708_31977 [subsurface metagenome]